MVTYENYISPHLLPPVVPLETEKDDPDEEFFIRTHQAFEIWFSQILAELAFARGKLSGYVAENDVPLVTHPVRRAAAIFDLLRAHLPVLETFLTTSFIDFRRKLFGAGGVHFDTGFCVGGAYIGPITGLSGPVCCGFLAIGTSLFN